MVPDGARPLMVAVSTLDRGEGLPEPRSKVFNSPADEFFVQVYPFYLCIERYGPMKSLDAKITRVNRHKNKPLG